MDELETEGGMPAIAVADEDEDENERSNRTVDPLASNPPRQLRSNMNRGSDRAVRSGNGALPFVPPPMERLRSSDLSSSATTHPSTRGQSANTELDGGAGSRTGAPGTPQRRRSHLRGASMSRGMMSPTTNEGWSQDVTSRSVESKVMFKIPVKESAQVGQS